MRRLLLALSCVLFAVGMYCVAQAQIPLTGAGSSGKAAGSGYQGPGDIVSGARVWYSCGRAYSASFAAGVGSICDIVDTATGLATCTIPIKANGFANLTAVVCPTVSPVVSVTTFCTVTHAGGCSVAKAYDQSGNANPATQATLANMPLLPLSALNSLPCPSGNGTSQVLSSTSGVTLNNPTTLVELSNMTSGASGFFPAIGTSSIAIAYGNNVSVSLFAGSFPGVTVTSAFHAGIGILAVSGNSNLVIDGTANSLSAGNATSTGQVGYVGQGGGGNYFAGPVCEIGAWASGFTSTQYGNMNSNIHSSTNGWNF